MSGYLGFHAIDVTCLRLVRSVLKRHKGSSEPSPSRNWSLWSSQYLKSWKISSSAFWLTIRSSTLSIFPISGVCMTSSSSFGRCGPCGLSSDSFLAPFFFLPLPAFFLASSASRCAERNCSMYRS